MQIVIDIPKDVYAETLRHDFWSEYEKRAIRFAIRNGTRLPRHYGDLKDVDAIKEEAVDMSQWGSDTAYGVWVEDIDAAPVIIPATKP